MTPSNMFSDMGVQPEAMATAEAEARRAGMPVGQWLNAIIRQNQSGFQGASPYPPAMYGPSYYPPNQMYPGQSGMADMPPGADAMARRVHHLNAQNSTTAAGRFADTGAATAHERGIAETLDSIIRHLEVSERRNAEALNHLESQVQALSGHYPGTGAAGFPEDGSEDYASPDPGGQNGTAPATRFMQRKARKRQAALDGMEAMPDANGLAPGHNGEAAGRQPDFDLDEQTAILSARLTERFNELAASLQAPPANAAAPEEVDALRQQLGDLVARFDLLANSPLEMPAGDAELAARVADLTHRIEAAEGRFGNVDLIEQNLAPLIGRLERVEQELQAAAQIRQQENQLFEQKFANLFEQMDISREKMVEAARQANGDGVEAAAREAAQEVARNAIGEAQAAAIAAAEEAARALIRASAPSDGSPAQTAATAEDARILAELQDNLDQLRSEVELGDRKTRLALDTVHDNLRAMNERISQTAAGLANVSAVSGPAPGEPPSAPAAMAAAPSTGGEQAPGDLSAVAPEPREPYIRPAEQSAEAAPTASGPGPDADDQPPLELSGDDAVAEESTRPREPGSGPPQAILDNLQRNGSARAALGIGAGSGLNGHDAPQRRPNEADADTAGPSLASAQTTNELLAAARRAAEAAANQEKASGKGGKSSLRDRLRIPALGKRKKSEKPNGVAAPAGEAKSAQIVAPAVQAAAAPEAKKSAVRKPILLATAAVILLAGSLEVYKMVSNRAPAPVDKPAPTISLQPAPEQAEENSGPAKEDAGQAAPDTEMDGEKSAPAPQVDGDKVSLSAPSAAALPEQKIIDQPAGAETTSSLPANPGPETFAANDARQAPPLPEGMGTQALRDAARDGDPIAQFEVASRFAEGRGVKLDPKAAITWYQFAAANGLAAAQYRLGSMYEKGTGTAQDREAAKIWYKRAAEQGNRKSMHNLAVILADGREGKADFASASRWFKSAAELGLGDSQYNLGILHVRGLGVPQNLSEAYKWFSIVARQGDKEAAKRRDAVGGQLSPAALAAAKLAAKTWKPKPMDPQANAIQLPSHGWAAQADESPAQAASAEIVRMTQKLLSELGYSPGPADGHWGPNSQNALKAFQRSAGLPETGLITPQVVRAMQQTLG